MIVLIPDHCLSIYFEGLLCNLCQISSIQSVEQNKMEHVREEYEENTGS